MSTDRYVSPLSERYASKEMQYIFSPDMKFRTWRRLWIALAETEKELGLNITQEQIDELKAHKDDINYDVAKERERQVRHDVMSHVYAYGVQCPKAKGIIHLGATSCYVGDNTDIIVMAEALKLVQKKLVNVIAELSKFADKYKEQPTLAFTHFQPAQPTTVGKRATLWTQEFLMDLEDLEYVMGTLKLLGSKGTTGTQASFLELFEGDQETIDKIDPMIAEKMGFKNCYPVSGQTYSRKVDTRVLNILAGIAASAHKMSNDIRLLQHLKEVEEPFEKSQIGSSAMAYKRNPMRSERIASLSRYVMVDALNPAITSATQWFERTLDDSANKRLSIPEGFLAIDGILDLCLNVVDGLVVYPKVIEKHMMAELPFMATENIMMDAVKAGGDRQELHERIRELSMEAGRTVKVEGKDNDLLERIAADPAFNLTIEELRKSMEPSRYVGRAKEQTVTFIEKTVQPVLDAHKDMLGMTAEINVLIESNKTRGGKSVMIKAVVGANWGDEGKGKITDMLAQKADIIVRFQGGANAGHTIVNDYGKFALHTLPSGVFYNHTTSVIGNGVALNIPVFFKEYNEVVSRGVPAPKIMISDRAQIVMPYHILFDQYEEERLGGKSFGSTKSGIAPFYSDKYAKIGFQVNELFHDDSLREKVERVVETKNILLEHLYHKPLLDPNEIFDELMKYKEMVAPYVGDVSLFLWNALKEGKEILLEGQLGSLKDPDHGIYPMVTSSSTLAAYGAIGAGVPPYEIKKVITVCKAYSSAVGAGAFVSEIFGEEADELRRRGGDGGEYGATTGRPRRMGWFDCVASKYGCRMQGATDVAFTVLDVLGYLDEIPVCTGYEIDGKVTTEFPTTGLLEKAKPVFEVLPGWKSDIRGIKNYDELPENCRKYIEFVEKQIGFPITMISNGPGRNDIIYRNK